MKGAGRCEHQHTTERVSLHCDAHQTTPNQPRTQSARAGCATLIASGEERVSAGASVKGAAAADTVAHQFDDGEMARGVGGVFGQQRVVVPTTRPLTAPGGAAHLPPHVRSVLRRDALRIPSADKVAQPSPLPTATSSRQRAAWSGFGRDVAHERVGRGVGGSGRQWPCACTRSHHQHGHGCHSSLGYPTRRG